MSMYKSATCVIYECTNNTLCIHVLIINFLKNDPYLGTGKNQQVMPQSPTIYLFSLGKEGNL